MQGLAHHFDDFEQQKDASYFGMWLFLVQEIMFFGGLFAAYVVYRVGRVWYLYSRRHDREVLDIPEAPEPEKN